MLSFLRQSVLEYIISFRIFRINAEDSLFTNPNSAALQIKFDEVFKKQLSQIEQFETVEASNDLPAILCTDLNNTQFSKTYKALSKGRIDAFAEAGNGLGKPFFFFISVAYRLYFCSMKISRSIHLGN